MTDDEIKEMAKFVDESFSRIADIFGLEGKTIDESAKAFAFFYNCLVCGLIKSSDLPKDKAEEAFQAIMTKTMSACHYMEMER